MSPRRFRPSRPRGGAARRRLVWAQRSVTAAATANNTWITVDLLAEYKAALGSTTAGITIMRTHGWVQPASPATNDKFWLGFGVMDLDDITPSFQAAATVRNPRDNPYVDWAFAQRYQYDVNTVVQNSLRMPVESANAIVDLKSRRKCHHIQETWAVSVLQDNVATPAKAYDMFFRTLIALP